jgi:hypothetical protein
VLPRTSGLGRRVRRLAVDRIDRYLRSLGSPAAIEDGNWSPQGEQQIYRDAFLHQAPERLWQDESPPAQKLPVDLKFPEAVAKWIRTVLAHRRKNRLAKLPKSYRTRLTIGRTV